MPYGGFVRMGPEGLPLCWGRASGKSDAVWNSRPRPGGPAVECEAETEFVAVRIRLKRFGRRHRSFYRLAAVDARRPRDGRVLEELGWYDPNAKAHDQQVLLNRERIEHWLGVGARPSDTVRDLLVRHGVAVKGG